MKKFKKYISLIMSVSIIFGCFFQSSLIAYATSSGVHPDQSKPIINQLVEGTKYVWPYLAGQVGALYNGDFESFLRNKASWDDYWNYDNISYDEETEEIQFSADLVSYIKQALTEYEQETNGYYILSTPSVMELDPTKFTNRNLYISLVNMINECGIVVYGINQGNTYLQLNIGDGSSLIDGTYSVAFQSASANPLDTSLSRFPLYVYDSDWKRYSFINCSFIDFSSSSNDNKIFSEIPEDDKYTYGVDNFGNSYRRGVTLYFPGLTTEYRKYCDSYTMIISKDGCRMRVFKSENAMKLYDAGKRAVYFTPDFYDKEPQEIVVKFDDLERYLNTDYDKYFKEIHDAIMEQGGNLSEDVIEKMTADILGKLDYNNSLTEEGNQISSYWLERIYKELVAIDEMMAAKLDSIIEYLKKIRNWTVADTIIDGVDAVADVVSLIAGILEDVDEGVGSAVSTLLGALDEGASLLSEKFPFSIPWDLLFFVTLLAHEPEVPYFEVPIDFTISALGIDVHYDFVIDFSSFQYLSDISRTILSMTYCVGLFKFTSNAVAAKKED
ncbi:MAG: hypothetical protein NC313_16645 [Butyrivibrio sp.]|nr:hypothetical protein [Butyrivibrio sp.]